MLSSVSDLWPASAPHRQQKYGSKYSTLLLTRFGVSFGRLDRKVRILRSWNQNERAAPDMADFSTKEHIRTTVIVTKGRSRSEQ